MTKERGALGRGLASILGNSNNQKNKAKTAKTNRSTTMITATCEILISQIVTNPFQPRKKFDHKKLNELAASIEQLGVIQPITVRKLKDNEFQLISGERRLKASQIAGFDKIPAYVRVANDQEMLEMALVENIQRENLNPIEVALSYKRLIDEIKLTQEECSKRVGKNRSTITNFLRLLRLPEIIQKGLSNKSISNGHARALLSIKDEVSKINLFHDIVAYGYSVREVEQIAKDFADKKFKRSSNNREVVIQLPFMQQKIIHDLTKKIKSEVEIKHNKKGSGKLVINYSSNEELERIISILNN